MKLVRAQANNNSKSNKKPDDNDLAFRGVVVEGRKQPLHHKPSLDEEKKMVSYFLGRDKALKKGRPMTIQSNSRIKNPYSEAKYGNAQKNNRFLISNKSKIMVTKNLQTNKEKEDLNSVASVAWNMFSKNCNANTLKIQLLSEYEGNSIIDSVKKSSKNRFAHTALPVTTYGQPMSINSIIFPNSVSMNMQSTKNSINQRIEGNFKLDPMPMSAQKIMPNSKTPIGDNNKRNSYLKSSIVNTDKSSSKENLHNQNIYNSDLKEGQAVIVVAANPSSSDQHIMYLKDLTEKAQSALEKAQLKDNVIDTEKNTKTDRNDKKYDEILEVSNEGYTNSRENSSNLDLSKIISKVQSDRIVKPNSKNLRTDINTPAKLTHQSDITSKSVVDTYLNESTKKDLTPSCKSKKDSNEKNQNQKTENLASQDNSVREIDPQKNLSNTQKSKKPNMHSKSKNENNANQNNSFSKTSNNKGSARVNAIKNTNPVNTNYSNNTNKSKTNLVGTVTISVPKNATPINNKKGNTFDNVKKTGSTIIKNDITEDSDLIFNVEIPAIQNDSK